MTPPPGGPAVRTDALAMACLVSLVVGLVVTFAWRWLAVLVLDVPSTLASVENVDLVLDALIPAVGNGIGYFASYRRPSRRSLPLFVGPSALLTCIGIAASLSQLPAAADPRAVVVTVVAVLITPVVVVGVLLTRRTALVPLAGKAAAIG